MVPVLVEWDPVYAGDEFCEQVMSEALVLFHFDVVDEPVKVERVSWLGGRDHVVVFRIKAAVFKHSAEEIYLANWAETSFPGCSCVV